MPLRLTRFRFAVALPAILSLTTAASAAAQVVVNGGAPNEGAGWNIFDDNRAAAMFSIGTSTSFDAIRFWGILPDGPTYTPDVYWQILDDDAGKPGTTVAAEGHAVADALLRTELTGSPGFFSWQFDLNAGSQTLGAGDYWLALHDGPLDPSGFTGSSLIWETTDNGQYAIQTFSVDDNWDVITDSGEAFELSNDVVGTPEPGNLVLLGTGLVAVGGLRVRRRRRSAPSD